MSSTDVAQILEWVRLGRSTIVMGSLPMLPPSLRVLRIRCDLPRALGPLDRARQRIETLLDGRPHVAGNLAGRDAFDGERERLIEERFVAACNRLAAHAPGAAVLVFDNADAADRATHAALARILAEPGRLLLPLIFVIHLPPHGSFLEVVNALARGAKSDDLTPTRLGPPLRERPADDAEPIRVLGPAVLRVLRGAALLGPVFEPEVLARLLEVTEEEVLEALQTARDAAVPIDDDGHGHFAVSAPIREALASTILPTLRRRWQRRLGKLYAAPEIADPLRSASHLEEAGDREASVEKTLDAVGLMLRAGDVERAAAELTAAESTIAALPRTAASALARTRAKLERARLGWVGAGASAAKLPEAFAAAIDAQAELDGWVPAEVQSDAAAIIAGIAYDLGDRPSLERADRILAETVTALVERSAVLEAAMLLNERSAIAYRMGLVLRTMDLLARSRELLEAYVKENPNDGRARLDLAATHHLLARQPLRPGATPPSEEECAGALARAETALRIFRDLGMSRDVGRVMETKARLLALLGRTADAEAAFTAAMTVAEQLGDTIGQARTTAGLAELLSAAGSPRDALEMLSMSIELNRQKGSPIGLAFDGRVLDGVESRLATNQELAASVKSELSRIRNQLASAVQAIA